MTAGTEAARNVYQAWHDATKAQDAKAIAALYAEDALFESASVLVLWPEHGPGIARDGRRSMAMPSLWQGPPTARRPAWRM